jgi:hypothetical protein
MIFLIEREKGNEYRFELVLGRDEIDPSEFGPVKNLFFCESFEEAMDVMDELQEMDK